MLKLPHKVFVYLIMFAFLQAFSQLSYSFIDDSQWQKNAKTSLFEIKNTLIENSAPAANKNDIAFQKWLNKGFKQSLDKIHNIKNSADYLSVLNYYLNGFHDEHIHFDPTDSLLKTIPFQWPGFFSRYNNNKYFVSEYSYASNITLPHISDEIISCDGKKLHKWMTTNVFPFKGNKALEADWYDSAAELFINNGSYFYKPPVACQFKHGNQIYTLKLNWQPYSINLSTRRAAYSYQPQFFIYEFAKDSVWISIPSFVAEKDKNLMGLRKIIKTMPQFRSYKLIVFDVRGNGGGNSEWGSNILKALYGDQFYDAKKSSENSNEYSLWRVSASNLDSIKKYYLPQVKLLGVDSEIYQVFNKLTEDMEIAVKQRKSDLIQETATPVSLKKQSAPNNLVTANILIVSDGRCGSSCLTFVDEALKFPDVTLVGHETHADTIYTEVREYELSNKLGTITFPMKVTFNRDLGNNIPFIPKYYFKGDINDTKALMEWIKSTIHFK